MAAITHEANAAPLDHLTVSDPVTGERMGSVPSATRDDVDAAAQRAREAGTTWQALGVKARAALLRRWAHLLWHDRDNAVRIIRRETGKSDGSAMLEVIVLDNLVDYYARHAPRWLRPQNRRPLFPLVQRARVHFKPYGVVGFITPWNYPLLNALVDLIPALIAGNTALLKPSELTPFSARYAIDLMYEAGIPRDVVQVVTGAGETGEAVVNCVDFISFTGSTATGRRIAVRAASRLIPYCLELGGKDAMLVLSDADIERAARTALRGAMENAGQTCISVERVYVEAPVYEAFVARVKHYAAALICASGDGLSVHVGSMTHARELERTEAHIRDAVEKGAVILCGGQRRPDLGPCFHEPTVLVNVDHTMRVMQEETFGPVLAIMRVQDEAEAVRLANDSPYGLSASVFTRRFRRGERVARLLDTGDVSVNQAQMVFATPSLPMGGQKQSGIGRRGGREGLLRFVTTQSILLDGSVGIGASLGSLDARLLRLVHIRRRLRRWLPFLT